MIIHAPAPSVIPPVALQREAGARGQICAKARNAKTAEAGKAGYSVTVAHPAKTPTKKDHRKSAFKERLSLNLRAAANPNTRQAPTNACAQKRLVYVHIGVPRDMARAPNAAA